MAEKTSRLRQAFAATQPPDTDLAAQIRAYDTFFTDARDKLYEKGADGIFRSKISTPEWQKPLDAINNEFDHPWEGSKRWQGLDRETRLPEIKKWIDDNGVTALSLRAHGYVGYTGASFEARFRDSAAPQIVSINARADRHPLSWNPFLHQPHARSVSGSDDFAMERGSPVEMVDSLMENVGEYPPKDMDAFLKRYPPQGFGEFMNQHILAGTPYKVKLHKDLGVLPDGTPVYCDPASVDFVSDKLARQHEKDQWDPKWQQQVMKTIDDNCNRLGLPKSSPLRWAVETSPGVFATQLSTVLPDPLAAKTQNAAAARVTDNLRPG